MAALKAKGVVCELRENVKPRMYYGHQADEVGVCPFVLYLPHSKYDVGFKQEADGTYSAVYDEWNNEVGRSIGAECKLPTTAEEKSMWGIGQFSVEYAKHAAMNAATDAGYIVEGVTTDAKTGELQVVITNC